MTMSKILIPVLCCVTAALHSCRTATPNTNADIKSSEDILDIQRINNDYLITCIDGSTQTIPASTFDTVPSVDICSHVLTSDCQPTIKYSNGQFLRQSSSTYNYASGRPLKSGGNVYYSNDKKLQVFKNSSGLIYFADGKPLRASDGTFSYPSGDPLKRPNGVYYYPGNRMLKQPNGTLYYPNGVVMKSANTTGTRAIEGSVKSASTFNYSSGNPMKTAAGAFYYDDQKQARLGNVIYRPDKSIAATPILIEQAIVDSGKGDSFGTLRFAVESTTDSFSLSLPSIAPEVGMLFEPKSAEFMIRYDFDKNDAPIILTFDEKGVPRLYLFIATGYKGERIVLFSSNLTSEFQCRAIHVSEN